VPRLIPGTHGQIISGTGRIPQIDPTEKVNRRLLHFMAVD
jgi:hypothetical protein